MKRVSYVSLPIVGILQTQVEHEFDEGDEDAILDLALSQDLDISMVSEWEAVRRIATGNVLHAPLNSAEIDYSEDIPEAE